MQKESLVAYIMNFVVSGYVYFVVLILVLYMVSSLVAGVFNLATGLLDLASSARGIISSPERTALELNLLHTIAFTIVLVKAYKILIAYAETRHINIKFLVEIAIIAPTIELIFNTRDYALETNILFASFALANLVAYLFFYKTLKKASDDYLKECETANGRS
jgi:uncharacterized membrane protein (DUF373 family)